MVFQTCIYQRQRARAMGGTNGFMQTSANLKPRRLCGMVGDRVLSSMAKAANSGPVEAFKAHGCVSSP
jgi:hypothetical protein